MWIKTTKGEYINTDYLSEMYVKHETAKGGEVQYWIAGFMPSGREKTHLIEGPFPTEDKAVAHHASLMRNLNRKIAPKTR